MSGSDDLRRVRADAEIDQWAAHIREALRKSMGIPPPRAPWDETNENEEGA